MKRMVTLVHRFGGTKAGLDGRLVLGGGKNSTSKVYVGWPLFGDLVFNAMTGLMVGHPRGEWRLSDEDNAAFAEACGRPPVKRVLKPVMRRSARKSDPAGDPRQLSLVER